MKKEGSKTACKSFLLVEKTYRRIDGRKYEWTDGQTQSQFIGTVEQFATWEIIETQIHDSTHENHQLVWER